jgi:predicted  nucleic acid-binding Zn-ribbon protein
MSNTTTVSSLQDSIDSKTGELNQLMDKSTKLRAAQENAAEEITEAVELLNGLRQSPANDPTHRERNKNNPQVMKGLDEFDKMLATGVQLEKDRREAGEKIAGELGQTKREIVQLQEEIAQLNEKLEQQKTSVEVDAIKDDLGIDFAALEKQDTSIDDLLQSSAKTTQAQLETTQATQANTVDRVQKDIDLCVNLQSKLQTERAALGSGVIDRVMNWRKISEIDKNLKEVTAKKTGREAMLTEAKAGLDKATQELEAHKKSFGVDDGGINVGTKAHISFHGHGEKQDQAKKVDLPNSSPSIDNLTHLVPKGHARK